MKRNHLSLAIGLTLSLAALQATAQEAAPAQAAQEDELATLDAVEVTARRRSESIQDVPVAVSAFGEDQLRDLQASNIDATESAVQVRAQGTATAEGLQQTPQLGMLSQLARRATGSSRVKKKRLPWPSWLVA